ncbi:MAG: arylsulfatase A-like enzyme [Planctomycetota bacterium]|jgi:arylsulfatase A-like enzyme
MRRLGPLHQFTCVLLALVLATAGCARPAERPDVLFISVDTLRRDHMSVYGYELATTPRLDEFAKEALVFTRAQTPRAKTTPAMASVFTGLYPHDHGVRDLASPLDRRVPVLAEQLRNGGYNTIGIVGNWVLTKERSGLHRGFKTWVEDLPDQVGVPPHNVEQRRAKSLTDAALELLELESAPKPEGDRAPWFAWLHYMDPHGAYDPPEEHKLFATEPDWLPARDSFPAHPIHKWRMAEYNLPQAAITSDGYVDLAHIRALYDGEIHYVDQQIGRLIDALKAAGRFDQTLIIITADHGESLGEHRYWFEHGFYTYEATCAVPLLIHMPGAAADLSLTGIRGSDVSLVDLTPTLLDFLRLPKMSKREIVPRRPFGVSFNKLLKDDREVRRPVFSEKVERADLSGTVQDKAVRLGDWKLIRRYTQLLPGSQGGLLSPGDTRELVVLSEELYDLRTDPHEENNLISSAPADAPVVEMSALLLEFFEADTDLADLAQILQRQREELERGDPESLRALEALGY